MTDPPPATIERLTAAVVSTARGVRGRAIFVGWGPESLPAAATALDALSPRSKRSLAANRGAGFQPRQVPYATLVPVEYVVTGAAIDFADTPDRRAEDQVRYTVLDAAGERRDIALGERALLGGIAAARAPWQSMGGRTGTELAVSAVPMYTLFAPLPGTRPDTGVAMLFRPTIANSTNEPAFRSFVRHTVGRLLVLDESQPPAARKGYLEVAGKVAGVPPNTGMARTLTWLRRTGFVDFSDQWLQGVGRTGQRMRGRFVRLLRAMGMVEIEDDVLNELTNPRPDYDVDKLDIEQMIDMAEQMFQAALRALA